MLEARYGEGELSALMTLLACDTHRIWVNCVSNTQLMNIIWYILCGEKW